MDSLCRVCLQNKQNEEGILFIPLFNDSNTNIPNKLMACARINVTYGDLLPKEICVICADKLDIAYDFKLLCERSYHKLIDSIKEKGFHVDVKVEADVNICLKQEPDADLQDYQPINEFLISDKKVEAQQENETQNSTDYHHDAIKNSNSSPKKVEDIPNELHEGEVDDKELLICDKSKKKPIGIRKRKFSVMRLDNKETRSVLVCDQCGQTFTSQNSLSGHQRRHKGERPYICSSCGKSFVVLSELKKHCNIHKTVKPYQCKYCDRRFADWGSRLKHERCHRGERPYKCDVCTKSFSYSYVLTRHKLTHTGVKLFGCDKCKKNFSVKYSLNNHVKTKHKDSKNSVSEASLENVNNELSSIPIKKNVETKKRIETE